MVKVALYEDRNMTDPRIAEGVGAAREYFESLAANAAIDFVYVPFDPDKFEPVRDADWAVLWGTCDSESKHKKGIQRRAQVVRFHRAAGHGTVCIEVGFLDRGRHYSIGLNDICGYGDYSPNVPTDHPLPRIPIDVRKRRAEPTSAESPVLLCGQVPYDVQIRKIDYMSWLDSTLSGIRKHANGRPVVFRPHPKLKPRHREQMLEWAARRKVKVSEGGDASRDIDAAFCVVAYNSNALLEAVMRRVPIVCLGPGSVVDSLSNKSLKNIRNLRMPCFDEIWSRVAEVTHYQWTADEIRKGRPLRWIAERPPRPEND
nr:hypothetical protein TetV2_00431 [Oceanusvirus sp.]